MTAVVTTLDPSITSAIVAEIAPPDKQDQPQPIFEYDESTKTLSCSVFYRDGLKVQTGAARGELPIDALMRTAFQKNVVTHAAVVAVNKLEGVDQVTRIAKVAHEINRAYCAALGDTSQQAWDDAPDWQRASAIKGVEFHIANPDAPPSASHESWYKEKEADGWVFGETKDPVAKTHPCMVHYDQLPAAQQAKDYLFIAVVRQLLPLVTSPIPTLPLSII